MKKFRDRTEAGRRLAKRLSDYGEFDPLVLGLPRGGVPVAYEVARALQAPLDIWIVRKMGVPWNPELAAGAVAEGGHVYLERDDLGSLGIGRRELRDLAGQKLEEVRERVRKFRADRPAPEILGKTVILVDDGIATGSTVRAAIESLRKEGPARIILAVPVAPEDTVRRLAREVDEVVALASPADFYAIGLWYENFDQVSDDGVVRLLEHARAAREGDAAESTSVGRRHRR